MGKKKTKVIPKKETLKGKFWGKAKLFLSIAGVIGLFLGLYLGFRPNIFIKPNTTPENYGNAILIPFTISNDGHFSIYNVKCSCAPRYIISSNYVDIVSATDDYTSEIGWNRIAEKLPPRGEYTEYMPLAKLAKSGLKPTKADIAIIVSFRIIKFVPWEFRRKFRFSTVKAKDGSFVWI